MGIVLSFAYVSNGQEMLGVVNSNYAGIYGIATNPSSMVTSKLYMDFNLLGVQASFRNNYIYLNAEDALPFLFQKSLPVYFTNENEERNFNIYTSDENKYGSLNTRIDGPGVMMVDNKHAYGFTTAFRTNAWFYDIPPDIATFLYEAIDYDSLHNIRFPHVDAMRVGSLAWTELSFSYAYNFHRYRWTHWSAGISLKPLLGQTGFFTNINELDYQVHTDTTASVYNTSFEYGLTLPIDYNDNSIQISPIIRGFGFAMDVGLTYQRTRKGHQNFSYGKICEAPYEAYNLKVGIAIQDLGFIKFKKKAISREYINSSAEWIKDEGVDQLPASSINEVVYKVDRFFKDNAESYSDNENFTIYLAPVINMNIDVPIKNSVYINGSVYYSLNFGGSTIYKPSIIALTPRYETLRFEVAVPISVIAWKVLKPKLGLSLRYGNFFIGMNDLTPLTGISDLSGIDIYGGIKLNLSRTLKMNYVKGNCGGGNLRNIDTFDFRNF